MGWNWLEEFKRGKERAGLCRGAGLMVHTLLTGGSGGKGSLSKPLSSLLQIKQDSLTCNNLSLPQDLMLYIFLTLYLSGLCLFPCPLTSISSSEESDGEVVLVLRRMCSCCAKYWEGVCLAARAQCSNSLWRSGKLAWK